MKTFRFVFFLCVTIALTIALDNRINDIPPLGKLLSPFHGYLQNAETAEIIWQEEISLSGLKASVSVYYDELRIPHIYAENQEDLHFVQGYLTARDRLWQMDFFSRLIYGRLAEVVDKEGVLNLDRFNRRIGLKRMTENVYEEAQKNPELKSILDAYSLGANAYIQTLSYSEYPLEFKLLDYEPEAWSPQKSCMGYAMLSNTLSRGESDLENTNAMALLGRELFELLYPEKPGIIDPVINGIRKWNFEPVKVTKPEVGYPEIRTRETLEKPNPLNGSNNFAVMGKKSRSGNVLLANEPDLDLTLPSIWYASHLHSPDKNVMGVTVPGTPVILIGFNDSISWGVTNSPRDQVDWFSVEFRDEKREEYWYNNQWFKTEKSIEKFKTADGETVTDTIVFVHHGPVVYDRNFLNNSQKVNYAMKWMAHQPSSTFAAMNEINKANNYEDFVNAIRDFSGPPQNIIFGSASGDISMWLPGTFPVKWEEQGKFLMDGSNPAFEYRNYIPFEHWMSEKNPERGFLSSANQHQVDSLYPYYVYDHNLEYYRNRRINDRLRVLNNITPQDMMKLQNDNFNYMASESLPFMLTTLDTASFTNRERDFRKVLTNWDFFNEPELKAPSIYQLWWNLLYQKMWDEFDTVSVAIDKPHRFVTIELLKNRPDFIFADLLSTAARETTSDLINRTFKETLDSLESLNTDYTWYQFKNTTIRHILRLDPFSRDQIKIGGYSSIVNAASKGHGPSWRMVVELDPRGTKAWGVYPGSQTGNPGSPLYGSMINDWASGVYYDLLFGADVSRSDKVIFTQTFNSTQ